MAPTITIPSVAIPPPVYTNEPFFGPSDLLDGARGSGGSESPSLGMERSIRQVMAKYGAADLHGAALLPSYRCLRRRRPQEENQAVAVTHDDTTYKIMLDVRDFAEGTLSVRAVGDDELVVEGVVEKKVESSPSENYTSFQSSSRNFQQRFMFPGLQVEGVTSSVSSDGVLTVTAPRKVSSDKSVEMTFPVTQSCQQSSNSSTSQQSSTSSQQTSSSQHVSSSSTVKQSSATTSSGSQVEGSNANQRMSSIGQGATEVIIPVTQTSQQDASSVAQSSVNKSSSEQQQQQQSSIASKGLSQESSTTTKGTTHSILGSDTRVGHIVPIEVEGQLLINTSGDVASNYTGQSLQSSQQKTLSESIQSSTVQESMQQLQQQQKQQQQQQRQQQQQQESTNATKIFKQTDNEQFSSQDNKVASNNHSMMNVPISTNGFGQTSSSTSHLSNMFKHSMVPIDTRGLFFQDSFFENSRRHFQDAVNKVLQRVSSDVAVNDPMNWYQSHRATNLMEDTRAGTITTEENDYKIVLDVRDFEAGSVSVRAVGDSELLVEGSVQKKTESTSISRSFRRRFVMPGLVKCEAITSALSADGVLTITAPKKDSMFQIVELKGNHANMTKNLLSQSSVFGSQTPSCASPSVSIPASSMTSPLAEPSDGPFSPVYSTTRNETNIRAQSESLSQADTLSQSQNMSQSNLSQSESQDLSQSQNLSQTSSSNTINESTAGLTRLQSDISECLNESSKIINSQREHLVPIDISQTTACNSNEKILNINYIDKSQKEIDSQSRSTRTQQEQQQQPQFQLVGSVKDLTDSCLKENVKQRKSVTSSSLNRDIAIRYDNPAGFVFPIVRRGPFYQDSFFNEVHQNFQSAIRQVLDRWVDVPSLLFSNTNSRSFGNFDRFNSTFSNYKSILDRDIFDDFTCYKSLRHRSRREESQASTVRENADDFKIVLDTHGFSEKDLTIRATSHNELIVEGKVEDKTAGSHTSHTFKRQFILPGPVRMDAVYSALSADDVLTITVPKNTALRITDKAQSSLIL